MKQIGSQLKMNSPYIEQFEKERELGNKAEKAYNDFISAFVANKRKALFQNFCDISIEHTEALLESKRLLAVVDNLEDEILNIIQTGKLASKSLEE